MQVSTRLPRIDEREFAAFRFLLSKPEIVAVSTFLNGLSHNERTLYVEAVRETLNINAKVFEAVANYKDAIMYDTAHILQPATVTFIKKYLEHMGYGVEVAFVTEYSSGVSVKLVVCWGERQKEMKKHMDVT